MHGPERALVQSTSDRKQVREAGQKERHNREFELRDLQEVLSTPVGRRVLWRVLKHCGVFESVFDGHGGKMGHNSGRQDVGHYLMVEIMEARSDAFAQMMAEAEEEKKKNG